MITKRTHLEVTCDECGAKLARFEDEALWDGNTWSSIELNGERFDFCDDDCRKGKVATALARLGAL